MINPFRPLGSALRDLFDDFLLLIGCNLLWALLSLPIWILAYSLLGAGVPLLAGFAALVGVLPAGPATIALYAVAYRVADGRASKMADFFAAMRQHARIGIVLTAIAVFGLVVILFNLGFYLSVNNLFGGLMLGVWLYLLISWLGVLIYAFPLVFLQEQPALRLIARNSVLMALGRPIFTVLTLLLMVILFLVSAYLLVPVLLFTTAFLSVWATRATKTLIDDARRRRELAAATAASQQVGTDEKGRKGQVRPK
jgi:uncharacterized membrane protein YesL